jgi:hypothetical protein
MRDAATVDPVLHGAGYRRPRIGRCIYAGPNHSLLSLGVCSEGYGIVTGARATYGGSKRSTHNAAESLRCGDALEKAQPCDGGHWYPGPLATKSLVDFIAGRPVSCRQVDYDHKNSPPVAGCFAGKDDLQALMVGAGWAWAYTAFSDQYVDAERRAAARGLGVHAHHCQPPWECRTVRRAERWSIGQRARHREREDSPDTGHRI